MVRGGWKRFADGFGEAGLILALCLTLTAVAWGALDRQADRFAEERFSAIATNVTDSIVKRMWDYEQILRGGVGLMEASDGVGRDEWRRFVGRLAVEDHYPGIQGIGFAQHVESGELAEHIRGVRAEGFPGYAVEPPGTRRDYFPIVFLEPFDYRNRRAFGYDMFAEPIRRDAMARARDSGRPALSGRVTLVQETDRDVQQGTLLYLPVYRPGADVSTVEARRAAILGFVYSPFRMDDLMTGILGDRLDEVAVRVRDAEPADDLPLFSRGSDGDPVHRRRHTVDVFGRSWVIEVAARPPLARGLRAEYPLVVLGSGLVISVLLMWLARSRVRERQRALALERSNHDLAQARLLAEQARGEAEAARSEAEAANRSKSKFLAAASHDIRQPVQSMMLLIEVLGQQLSGHPAARLVEPLDKSLDALRMLLNGLLDISKLDAGVVEATIEAVELDPLLARLVAEYQIRAATQGLELRRVPCSLWVRTDKALLERILRNLIENALRYTDRGRVLLGCRRRRNRVRIEVIDTGIGIASEHVGQIFQEFHQVGNPERDRSQGLGLGLAIVRRLAQMLGHDVSVWSEPGRGSCFSVTVPLTAPARAAEDPPTRSPAVEGALALVIDDEAMVREGFRGLFERWGYQVITAGSAAEAVSAVAEAGRRPTLILADYRLRGGETGTDAIRRVGATVGAEVPAVIVTGDTAPERIIEAERSGYHILHKPVTPADLHAAVTRAVGEPVA